MEMIIETCRKINVGEKKCFFVNLAMKINFNLKKKHNCCKIYDTEALCIFKYLEMQKQKYLYCVEKKSKNFFYFEHQKQTFE